MQALIRLQVTLMEVAFKRQDVLKAEALLKDNEVRRKTPQASATRVSPFNAWTNVMGQGVHTAEAMLKDINEVRRKMPQASAVRMFFPTFPFNTCIVM